MDNARLFSQAEASRLAAEDARRMATTASQAKGAFLATMSHEIRTPINAILGYSELLGLGLSGPLTPAQEIQLGRIQSSTQHLLTLVEEVLDLSKVEAGILRVDSASVLATETCEAAVSMVCSQAEAKGVSLVCSYEGPEPVYVGDPGRVRQILGNLLSNAVKFTGRGGSVRISRSLITLDGSDPGVSPRLFPGRRYVRFRVEDTGHGIPADQLEKIFEPFVQAESTARSPYAREWGGAGLGLAISRNLAWVMDGDITATSVVGSGSVFMAWIPASSPQDFTVASGEVSE